MCLHQAWRRVGAEGIGRREGGRSLREEREEEIISLLSHWQRKRRWAERALKVRGRREKAVERSRRETENARERKKGRKEKSWSNDTPQSRQMSNVPFARQVERLKEVRKIRVRVSQCRKLPVQDANYARFSLVEDLSKWKAGKGVNVSESSDAERLGERERRKSVVSSGEKKRGKTTNHVVNLEITVNDPRLKLPSLFSRQVLRVPVEEELDPRNFTDLLVRRLRGHGGLSGGDAGHGAKTTEVELTESVWDDRKRRKRWTNRIWRG
jgi:hypothetical protein